MKRLIFRYLSIFILSFYSLYLDAQVNPKNRQVVLQGFWWDYWNTNFPNGWSNYLTELAPRLKELGVDAIWIPPNIKNTGTNSVGYAPFDHYDLGDKFQKNSLKTRMGDKDELLRMIAVMKANGIDVIQDIVLNHVTGAGSASGGGGQDVTAMDDGATNKYKNFRYVSYSSPATNETSANYLSRMGRFSKNWENFYPNNSNACCTNDINSPFWGPDISYESNAFGLSGNATYNPVQGTDYMRSGMRNWLIWYKKQAGWDGVRIDAVKHFPAYATEDFLWNLQNNAVWASGTDSMFAVGEWVGSSSELDAWDNAVQNRAGTFDFGLRFALSDIISGNGNYNLGTISNAQQLNRQRTVPFVNNHDTYRPTLDASGNYTGWNTSSQIGNQIEPNDPRASVAYAIALSVDGSPEIFFEDLFNIGYLSNRFSHHPTVPNELPTHSDMENLLWCHQNLHFKDGAYFVRWQAADAFVAERQNKALIAVNDHYTVWQNLVGVQTSFADGTILTDYSGANGTATRTVYGGGKADISIPPCNGSALLGRKGYAVWAPQGITTNYNRTSNLITQEWEMEDDLGDNSPGSLQQGGRLPNNSRDCRVVGRVFSDTIVPIVIELFPSVPANSITIEILDKDCQIIDTVAAAGAQTFSVSGSYSGWYTIRIRNTNSNTSGQKCWVKTTYKAPQVVQTNVVKNKCACSSSAGIEELNPLELSIYPNPVVDELFLTLPEVLSGTPSTYMISNMLGEKMKIGALDSGNSEMKITVTDLNPGTYLLQLSNGFYTRFVKM
jgi:alpha-amylase